MDRHAETPTSDNTAMGVVDGWLSGVLDSDTPPEELTASAEALGEVRRATLKAILYAARRSDAPPEALAVLAKDDSGAVRTAVAENPSTPQTVLADLVFDSEPSVLSGLAANPSTPEETLLDLVSGSDNDDDTHLLWEVAGNRAATDAVIARVLDHEYADDELCMRVLHRDDFSESSARFIAALSPHLYEKSVAFAKSLLAPAAASPSL